MRRDVEREELAENMWASYLAWGTMQHGRSKNGGDGQLPKLFSISTCLPVESTLITHRDTETQRQRETERDLKVSGCHSCGVVRKAAFRRTLERKWRRFGQEGS